MSESYRIRLGNPLPLSLQMPAGATGLFPRARIYDSSDVEVAGSPFDLTEVGSTARYTAASFTPLAIGTFVARFVPFTDSGHTIEAVRYTRDQDSYNVLDVVEAFFARTMETGFDFDRMFRIVAAATAGKVSGTPANPVFRNLIDTLNMISGAADATGARTGTITYGA